MSGPKSKVMVSLLRGSAETFRDKDLSMKKDERLPTPGEALRGFIANRELKPEALERLVTEKGRVSAAGVAWLMHRSANRVTRIIGGRSRITAETALLLEAIFEPPAEYWMQLQSRCELAKARGKALRGAAAPARPDAATEPLSAET